MNHVSRSSIRKKFVRFIKVLGAVILVVAGIPPILTYFKDWGEEEKARKEIEQKVSTLLYDARDLMSTNPASGVICTGVPLTDGQRVKIRSAQRKLDEAEKLDPSNYQVYTLKAGSYLLIGNFNEALKLAKKSVQLEEENSKAYPEEKNGRPLTVLGGVYQEMDKVLEAEEALRGAIKKNENDPYFYSNLGWFYLELDRKKEAHIQFREAKRIGDSQGIEIKIPDDKNTPSSCK